jgi:hypothetical protein
MHLHGDVGNAGIVDDFSVKAYTRPLRVTAQMISESPSAAGDADSLTKSAAATVTTWSGSTIAAISFRSISGPFLVPGLCCDDDVSHSARADERQRVLQW